MLTTRFTKLVGCSVPIQQAGMGAASPSELAAAVADRTATGEVGAMALHAGESVSAVKRVLPREKSSASWPRRRRSSCAYGRSSVSAGRGPWPNEEE
jgi:NAD(P)H-dependent flavin oxidoreductase YrpB (nitropropane dioxygenase family)